MCFSNVSQRKPSDLFSDHGRMVWRAEKGGGTGFRQGPPLPLHYAEMEAYNEC